MRKTIAIVLISTGLIVLYFFRTNTASPPKPVPTAAASPLTAVATSNPVFSTSNSKSPPPSYVSNEDDAQPEDELTPPPLLDYPFVDISKIPTFNAVVTNPDNIDWEGIWAKSIPLSKFREIHRPELGQTEPFGCFIGKVLDDGSREVIFDVRLGLRWGGHGMIGADSFIELQDPKTSRALRIDYHHGFIRDRNTEHSGNIFDLGSLGYLLLGYTYPTTRQDSFWFGKHIRKNVHGEWKFFGRVELLHAKDAQCWPQSALNVNHTRGRLFCKSLRDFCDVRLQV